MPRPIFIDPPPDFSFQHTIRSHGWYDLDPFELNDAAGTINYVFVDGKTGISYEALISENSGKIKIVPRSDNIDRAALKASVRHLLRLDDDLSGFHAALQTTGSLPWVTNSKAGRLLRSPTVFEDLVKTICTTNCSWALTKKMVTNLVEKLGEPAANGKRAFPTAAAMASQPEEFYREEIKAGYRSPYFVELAQKVAEGELDPESWLATELSTADLKKEMKKVKGVGDYAAENLLKLVGRYDGLALDSWLRSGFYKKHNGEKVCTDKKIERHYKKFGEWKGLAIWCDMTERWFTEGR